MSEPDRTHPPAPGPVLPFDFPAVTRSELPSGLRVLAARHGDLPLVTAEVVVDAGAERDGRDNPGLAYLTAHALESGTGELSADDLAWELERLGIELDTDVGWDSVALRLTVTRERLESAMQILSALVRSPSFPAEEIQRLREEQLADLLQRRKEPRALASDMAARFIFARDTPYARPLLGTAAAVEKFERDAVVAFHRRHYAPDAATLILVGDIEPAEAEHMGRRHFGDWAGRAHPAPQFAVEGGVEKTTIFIVDRPGAVQSEIRIGHVGIARGDPDYFPVLIANTILGGAFTSRLNMSLRERHGFTYGARSAFDLRRRPGPFFVQVAVATDVTAPAVREAVREIRQLAGDGATTEEVANARAYVAGVMPLQLQTTDQLAARLADVVIYSLPDDYFDHYRERIAAVDVDDVRRVSAERLQSEGLAIVAVGDARSIEQPLRDLEIGDIEIHRVG